MSDASETEKIYPAAALARAGVKQPYQVLLWVPRAYRNYSCLTSPADFRYRVGEKVLVRLTVTGRPQDEKGAKFKVWGRDDSGQEHKLTIFGKIFVSPWRHVTMGECVYVEAKVTEFNGQHYLNGVSLVAPEHVGRVVPVYSGKAGVIGADAVARAAGFVVGAPDAVADACIAIRQAFGGKDEAEILALARAGGGTLEMLLYQLHRPATVEMAEWAQSCARALAIASIRHSAAERCARPMRVQSILRVDESEIDLAFRALPYKPTRGANSQESAIREIVRELAAPRAMDAILTADVGVGKTLCYMVPAVLAQRRGARIAVLVPNTVLADNIASEFAASFPDSPVAVVTDATKKVAIEWDKNPILLGTTRIFKVTAKQRWHPDFLIIDEQQKMSAAQREALCTQDTNVLEASATPMPQTLALLRYGTKTQFRVDAVHAQKTLHTAVVGPAERGAIFGQMRALVAAGDQVAVIYPRVAASGAVDAKSVIAATAMWERHFPGNVVALHGRMSDEEKIEALRLAKSCERQVIVASSIFEIGITVPRLRGLMVVNADRYGTSTLHQMRGRLARLGGEGWFWLYLPDEVEDETWQRVNLLTQTTNGFELAELDMALRGFGTLSDELGEVSESGATRTLFRGVDLRPADLEQSCAHTMPDAVGTPT